MKRKKASVRKETNAVSGMKGVQEQKEEERTVAKSRPTAVNLSSAVSASSSSAKDTIASKSLGILRVSGKPDARERRDSKPDAASSFQGRLQDAYCGGLMDRVAGKPAATDKRHEKCEFSESESWSNHEKEVTGKPVEPRNSGTSESSKAGSRKWHIIFICLQQLYLTWIKSIRSYERFTAEVQRMTWVTST